MMAPKTMSILAIDPGPRSFGWAHLSVEHSRGVRCTYVAGGCLDSTISSFLSLTAQTQATALAIEVPRGYSFATFRVPHLLDTARVAGGMLWLAEERRMQIANVTAQQVRKLLCGKASANDEAVADVVRGNVFGCPLEPNEHVADALAVGVLGAWMLTGKVLVEEIDYGKRQKKRQPRRTAAKASDPRKP